MFIEIQTRTLLAHCLLALNTLSVVGDYRVEVSGVKKYIPTSTRFGMSVVYLGGNGCYQMGIFSLLVDDSRLQEGDERKVLFLVQVNYINTKPIRAR